MDFQLVVIKGRAATTALKLQDGVTTAGRQDDCHLRIRSSQVSRKHCELFEKHGLLLVKDLGSSNGTFVNGKKIDGQRVMEPGDELAIGPISFRVEKVGQPAPARPAAAPAAAKSPGDTDLTGAIGVAEAVPDEDFEIEFDETPSGFGGDDMGFEIEIDDAPTALAEPEETAKPAKPTAAKAKEPEPKPEEPAVADDAIADFLSGIKLDD
jgi:pSer/pThr/pTyr-binding forkhead associated (FHA) protein